VLAGIPLAFLAAPPARAATPVSGPISVDTTWGVAGSPYLVVGDVTVEDGVTLTIDPGVLVQLDPGRSLIVQGTLDALGTATEPIRFTANASGAPPPSWKRIWSQGGFVTLDNATVEHAETGVHISASLTGGAFPNVIRNSLLRHNTRAVDMAYGQLLTARGNEFLDNENGVSASYPTALRVIGNRFERTANTSIFIYNAQINTVSEITDNLIADGYHGLSAFYPRNVQVLRNAFLDNDFLGLSLYEPAQVAVEGNLFARNGAPGASGGGVRVTGAYGDPLNMDVRLRCNEVHENLAGVQLVASRGVVVQSNNIVNNTQQATDDGNMSNDWDNGTAGNHWSDYAGVDADGNGIGDSPYGIDLDSLDEFPLIAPFDTSLCGAPRAGERDPVAEAGGPYSGGKNRAIPFDGSASFDPDGGAITGYAWDFGDGGTGSGAAPTHTYSSAGVFTVTLTVTDDEASTGVDTATATIVDLPPGAPGMIVARLVGASFDDVELEWALSPDDGGLDDDVAAYDILFGTAYEATAASYALLGSVPAGTTTFTHVGGGAGASAFFYLVVAREGTGRTTAAAVQAGKFARTLSAGDQLVSVPLVQEDWRVETVFETIPWSVVRTYGKPHGHGHNWHSARNGHVWQDLSVLDATMAAWVDVTAGGIWRVAGLVPASTSIDLEVGWNFLGYPSFTAKTVGQVLAGISYQTVEGYADDPPHNLARLGPGDLMGPGRGYWIHVSDAATLTFTN